MMGSTVLINCSPKRRMSASGFLARCAALLIGGEKKVFRLRTPSDHQLILQALLTAEKVVFVTPLYVDSLPSHVLEFMQKLEGHCRENQLRLKVYAIANNGFIEGRQNEPLMQVLENFSARSGLTWCGGVGIGGGVMLNVERIVFTVLLGLTALRLVLGFLQGESPREPLLSLAVNVGELALLACGIIVMMLRLAVHVRRGTDAGKRYTRIMVPSFLFILFADIFFTIISVLQGGIFRGWLSRPMPKDSVVPDGAGEK